jgi:multisubunit Na+/H+ antiporter MnhB subunit
MKRICTGFVMGASTILLASASYVLANEPKGEGPPDYSGISSIYYILIGLILAYGVYDSFFKKS